MKHLFYLLTSFLLLSGVAHAQKLTVTGTLRDTTDRPLSYATVMMLKASDSALVAFDRSNDQGSFQLRNLNPGAYLLKITYVGFFPYWKAIPEGSTGTLDLGKIRMREAVQELGMVTIQADVSPVTIRKDTVEFNAGSFQPAKPNSNVEDLLKRMPGVEIQSDGSIKVQGEDVRRITVNGKEFFGRDPKMATRNLPSKAIQKVQVFDRKSDMAAFSGIDDGQTEKTINLELKDEFSNGGFGNFAAGAGVDSDDQLRYESRGSYNRFSKTSQLSLLGMGNNVNQQGFSVGDYLNFSGQTSSGLRGGGGGIRVTQGNSQGVPLNFGNRQNGIMTNLAGGANSNYQFANKKTEVNGSYLVSHLDHNLTQDINRENFLPDRSFSSVQSTVQQNLNTSHRANMTLDHKIDSANVLKFTSSLTYNQLNLINNTENENFTIDPVSRQNILQNDGFSRNLTEGMSMSGNAELLFRHRFAKKGRTLSTSLTLSASQNDSEGTTEAVNRFYRENGIIEQPINQERTQNGHTYTYGTTVLFTEPLGKRRYLELSYNLRNTDNRSDQRVYDIREGERTENQNLTNLFENNFLFHRAGMNFRWNMKKVNLTAGANFQSSELNGNLPTRQTSLQKNFTNLLPLMRMRWDFSNLQRLNFDYDTDINAPSITQLQPLVDNSDPLNIYVGNPDLRPEYNHRFRLNFLSFDPIRFTNFFALINASYITNRIVNAQLVDERLVRTTQPVNTDNFFTINGNFNFSFQWKKAKSRFSMGPTARYSRSINLLNDLESFAWQNTVGGNFRYDFRPSEKFDLGLRYNLSRQQTDFEFEKTRNQVFLNQTYGAEANATLPLGLRASTDLEYLIFDSPTTGFRQELPLLNLSLSRFFLKNEALEVKIGAVNLLDQNLGVQQQADVNFLQQTVTNNLGRYWMLTITYALNKALNPMGSGRPGGGRGGYMMRMGG